MNDLIVLSQHIARVKLFQWFREITDEVHMFHLFFLLA